MFSMTVVFWKCPAYFMVRLSSFGESCPKSTYLRNFFSAALKSDCGVMVQVFRAF